MKSAQIFRIARTGHKTANSGVFFAKSDFRGRGTPLTTHCSKFPGNFWKSRNFEAPNTQNLNKNAPELSVSGTALTILKFWAKTITFEESYGESKFGSQTLYRGVEICALSRPPTSCAQSRGIYLKRSKMGFLEGLWVADLSVIPL